MRGYWRAAGVRCRVTFSHIQHYKVSAWRIAWWYSTVYYWRDYKHTGLEVTRRQISECCGDLTVAVNMCLVPGLSGLWLSLLGSHCTGGLWRDLSALCVLWCSEKQKWSGSDRHLILVCVCGGGDFKKYLRWENLFKNLLPKV